MKIRAVETTEGADARVNRVFPNQYLKNYDPFVLLDEFFVNSESGFPDHEHRGFEAVTYMLEGSFRHKDNIGNDTEVFPGGAQRFTAGSGIIHSEMPGSSDMNHGLQLWVNLPKRFKKDKPSYQQVNVLPELKKDKVIIKTITGEGSPVKLITPVLYQDINMEKGSSYDLKLPDSWKGLIYLLEGKVNNIKKNEALFFNKDITVKAEARSRFVFIAGKPHNEPIIQNGPFVD